MPDRIQIRVSHGAGDLNAVVNGIVRVCAFNKKDYWELYNIWEGGAPVVVEGNNKQVVMWIMHVMALEIEKAARSSKETK